MLIRYSYCLGILFFSVFLSSSEATLPVVGVQAVQDTSEASPHPGQFLITRQGDSTSALKVNFQISGSALNGIDYQSLASSIIMPADSNSVVVSVLPGDDGRVDADKSVQLTLLPDQAPFSLIALPDTQYYTDSLGGGTPAIFASQTQWIVDHKLDYNINFVLHEGDITDNNVIPEWQIAKASLKVLDGVVPYALAAGNHDGLMTRLNDTALFNQYFPVSQFQGQATFGGVFESNKMDNCFYMFSAGGVDWMIVSLEFGPRNEVLDWANQIISQYPDRRVIYLSHTHIYSDSTLHGSLPSHQWKPTDYGRFNNGTDVWQKMLRRHANTSLAFNGHVLNNGTGRWVGTNDGGNLVYQMLANYQTRPLGGGGFLRIMQFFPGEDRMSVRTYSPYLNQWLTDTNNQFEYTNLGIFSASAPQYEVDAFFTNATLTISNSDVDVTPPQVLTVSAAGRPTQIRVQFSEPLDTNSALDLTHFSVHPNVTLVDATLLPDGQTVILQTATNLSTVKKYTLTVAQVSDLASPPNTMETPVQVDFTNALDLLTRNFVQDGLSGWSVVDEGALEGPSKWIWEGADVKQDGNIYGPSTAAFARRKGTFLYWNDPAAVGWSNYTFAASFNAGDDDGVGLMFRYSSPSNYYKVELDQQRNFHTLFKVVQGIETTLATEAGGYSMFQNHILRVDLTNNVLSVKMDGHLLFGGPVVDASLPTGTVALYSWASTGLTFSNVTVKSVRRPPQVHISPPVTASKWFAPGAIPLIIDSTDADAPITKVELFQGTNYLGTLGNATNVFNWDNVPPGNYILTAFATDDDGDTNASAPLVLSVAEPDGRPYFAPAQTSRSFVAGDNLFLRAPAAMTGGSYQWFRNGQILPNATNSFLYVAHAVTADAGTYAVQSDTNSDPNPLVNLTSVPFISSPPPSGDSPHFVSIEMISGNCPLMTIASDAGAALNVQVSSNLTAWDLLDTVTNNSGTAQVLDTPSTTATARFYRVLQQ